MTSRENLEEFLRDLSLIAPNLLDYGKIDWVLLVFWGIVFVRPIRNHSLKLFLLSTVELMWGAYDLSIGEYAQGIAFFFYFLVTLYMHHKKYQWTALWKKRA